MIGFGSLDNTDPLYALGTQVELVQMPEVNATPPRLGIQRQGDDIALVCQDAGTRQFTLEAREEGSSWRALQSLVEGQTWKSALPRESKCVWYRLRLSP